MPDPTIPELVARLRELHAKLQALQAGTPEFTAARQLFRDVLQLSAPAILDALICYAIFAERARHAEEVARLRDVHLDETRALDDLRLKEIASLRDQLRRVEGERDEAQRRCGELHEHLARAWEEGAEAAFDAQAPSEDCDYLNPLYGRALDEFYASNPYRRAKKGGGVAWESGGTDD